MTYKPATNLWGAIPQYAEGEVAAREITGVRKRAEAVEYEVLEIAVEAVARLAEARGEDPMDTLDWVTSTESTY